MTRCVTYGTLVTCVLGVLGASGRPPQVFRSASDVVRVFVTVTDRDGRLVTRLGRDDFEVRDEGKAQPITLFDNTPLPIRLIVMLDTSGSMEGNLPLLREAADQLFAELRPDDVARVGAFGRQITISQEFTRDAGVLRQALPDVVAPDAPTPLWSALDEAMDAFGDPGDERRVILVLSDGKDTGPIGFGRHVASQAGVIDRARDDNVMIYAIGLHSRGSRRTQPGIGPGGLRAAILSDLPDPGLARVAEDTGGGYAEIRYGQDLGAAFARVAEELHSQYLLGFAPPKRDGKAHDIDVRLAEKGLKARARKSYLAPKV